MNKFLGLLFIPLVLFSCKKKEVETNETTDPATLRTTTTVNLAYDTGTQTDPMCFLDLDLGTVYSVSTAAANADKIDIVYVLRYTPANDPMFISLGSFDGQNGYPISSWDKTSLGIGSFSTFNHTVVESAPSSLTTANFNAITKLSQLKGYIGNVSTSSDFEHLDPSHVGNIYQFRTQQGKVGAFKLNACQNGSSGFATIEIVLEK